MTPTLRPLGPDDLTAVIETFPRAFADYLVDLRLTRDDLVFMMDRRGADLTASVGAFDGDAMVAFMVVALDDFEGIRTAYDVFTGVVPDARGQGLARRLFDVAVPVVAGRGAERFALEVIREHEAALRSYRKAGFEERRVLRVFAFDDVASNELDVEELPLDEAFASIPTRVAAPSWQNSDASIRRVADAIVPLCVRDEDRTLGIAFAVPMSRDVPQIHALPGRDDVVRALLSAACARRIGDGPLRVVNVDARSTALCDTLARLASEEYPAQFEMVRTIDPVPGPA